MPGIISGRAFGKDTLREGIIMITACFAVKWKVILNAVYYPLLWRWPGGNGLCDIVFGVGLKSTTSSVTFSIEWESHNIVITVIIVM